MEQGPGKKRTNERHGLGLMEFWLAGFGSEQRIKTQARAAAAHRSSVRLVALTSALPLPLLPTSVPPM